MSVVETLTLASLLFWLLLFLDRRRSWPGELTLPKPQGTESDKSPASLTAIVPARDEAEALAQTLPALLRQGGSGGDPWFRVVVVDDNSADGTAERARIVARELGCGALLRVVQAPATPAGWAGKVHALAVGVDAACRERPEPVPEWLLLVDADIQLRPDAVAGLLQRAAERYDLVSVMARLHARRFWERLLIPPFVFFFQLLYPFRMVCKTSSRVAAAAGGCVLLRRQALEAAGGLAAIRDAVIDDVSLARAVKAAGGRLWLGLDPEIVSIRPYRHLSQLWNMVARSAFVQLDYRYSLLLAVLLALGLLFVAPAVLTLSAGLITVTRPDTVFDLGDSHQRTVLWGGLCWLLQSLSLLPAVRHHRVPWPFALTLPLAALLYALMTLTSAWRHLTGRGVKWKGRSYSP